MRDFLHHLLLGSLRRQLVTGTVLCVALTLSALVWDLTRRQQEALLAIQPSQTAALQERLSQLTRDGVFYVLLGTLMAAVFSVLASALLTRRGAAANGLAHGVELDQHDQDNSATFQNLILDSVAAGVAVIDHQGTILSVNEQWRRFALGNSPQTCQAAPNTDVGSNYLQACGITHINTDPTLALVREGVESVLAGRSTQFCLDYPAASPDQQRWFSMVVRPVHLPTHNGAVITYTDISTIKLTERLEQFRGHVLELMTGDASLADLLHAMVLGVEQLHPAMLCSILLLDSQGRHLERSIAPSLPDFYNQALVGMPIGIGQGSCGTAATTGERVIVEDIATHPYWANYKALAQQAGLRACWSQPVLSASGRVLGTFAIYHRQVHSPAPHDIALIEQSARLVSIALDQKATQEALRASEDMFRTLFETLPTGVLYENLDGVITSANPAAQRLLGLTLDQLQGTTSTDPRWHAIHEDGSDFPGEQHPISRALRTGQPVRNVIMGIAVPERDYVWLLVSAMPLFKDGKLAQAYVVFEDVTDRHEMELQVRHMAFYDALTQLPNRRLLIDRLAQAITASRRSGCYGAMMYIDLDNFKPLNDRHGHELGDMLLSELARRLKACVREVDTVARIGGDEFVVMLTDLAVDAGASSTQAQAVAAKILASLAAPYVLTFCDTGYQTREVGHLCTASIGVTLFSHHDTSQEQILQRADTAMYQAKGEGRNRVHFFEGFGGQLLGDAPKPA
ncbi:diguanylate cyclase domain-containing protein [Rhodoferax sp. U11-2br]|uniref:diguanylate cyclase domain-containing protein n=1 Tax=Rhodoferax sp. U11-2br TaxID=2838878 RepID=UPI001BE5BAE8|nr:diguanylate cyclase [Rhodoferax sp. U11-2br]MBT3066386.1 diguanylate cyclase [Rhodoferax sp. U11-2br]